ncbi:MAG: isopeptide-forming domain-containing fimbrial protein [Eubacteriales bacterium]|nr:isopeptide-forming domain-containing fimbrial protein [Eubacteriales bacterium]
MKQNRKERLEALLLAVLFLAQAILGILPARRVMADASVIERWDENTVMDYGYRFNVKYQPGITKVETYGCDNLDKIAFTNHGRSERNADTVRMTGNYKAESAGVRYYNVGRDGEGNIIDFKMSLVSVENPEPRYDMQTAVFKHNEAEGQGTSDGAYDFPDNIAQPLVGFSLEGIGMYIYCVDSARVHMQFLKNGTDEPIAISGHGTVRDLDARQGIFIPPQSRIDSAYILSDNTFLEVDGMKVTAGNDSLVSGDKKGWVNFLYNTDSMYFDFVHEAQLDRWDSDREKGIKKYGSQEAWAARMKKNRTDTNGVCHCPDFDGGKFMRGHAYFDFTAYCFGGIAMDKAPEKRVGALGCTWEQGVASGKEEPFLINDFDEFQYMVQTEVTPNQFNKFVVEDVLEDCLTIQDESKVLILDDTGQNVTERFDIAVQGQKITCNGKQEAMAQESFSNNQNYTFIFTVHRKPDADVSHYAAPDGYSILVPNSASMSYERTNGTGDTMQANTIWVRGVITPELELHKNVSKYEWAAGDVIDYNVTVTQTKENTRAAELVMEDAVPPGLELLEEECRIEAPGVADCSLVCDGQNGWRVSCPSLGYGQTITVWFKCRALEESNGQECGNVVSVTAKNLINKETNEQETIKDIAEVWVNSPQLTIDKTADKYEWSVGDAVSYRIVVNNPVPGTIARDVRISDIGLPEGLILAGGLQSVEILDVLQEADYPVPDKKTGQMFEKVPVESHLEGDEGGFAFYCSHIPFNRPVTILFRCMATENANGRESVNEASVQAGNAPELSDDAEVYINSGEFWIEKTADHYEWQVGEQVAYTVVVENRREGTIARNVTIWDTSMPSGLALSSPDSVTVSGIPSSVTQPVPGTADIPGMLNPEAYNETAEKTVSYEFVPEGTGWRLNITDLPFGVPITVTFLCTVTEEVNGMESINTANVQAENTPPQADDTEIYVNSAVLSVEKSVQNPYLAVGDGREANEFRVGEQVNYQVVVDNLQKGSIAKNVVISDLTLPEGLTLDEDEEALMVYGIPQTILYPVAGTDDAGNALNPENYNEVVEKHVEYQILRQGTGWILTISDLPYHTPVTVNFRCTVQESINGLEIANTASARAENAAEVKGSSKVWINSPVLRVEKKADKPSYKYGDIITYRVTLTQEQTGCVARNVILKDMIETPGVRLLKDSIVLLDEQGKTISAASVEANDENAFFVQTGRNLVKDAHYSIFDRMQGGIMEQVLLNPLELWGEKQMTIEYCAAVIDEKLAGQSVHNISTANSQENISQTGEETVEIHSPILEVVKESDKKEYKVGEKGYFTIVIRQLREDVTAENIVVEDTLASSGAIIKKDSILLKKNGEIIKAAAIEATDSGFRITTGATLSDRDKLEVCYEVLFQKLPQNGSVVNTARAWADGTPETEDGNEVCVTEKTEPVPSVTPTPRPTVSPIPTPTLKPTGTPIPTAPSCPKLTPAPTGYPGITHNNSGGNGTSSGNNYPGGGNSFGNYQTGGAKTGDERPFAQMARLGLLGALLIPTGIVIYRKARKKKVK